MNPIRICFLGSGDAFCAGGRDQAACLLQSGEGSFLIDCGATALASLKRRGKAAGGIDAVLVSHLHGDHIAGLPFLFLEYTYLEPRRRPLRIAGPPGLEERAGILYEAEYRNAARRPLPFPVDFTELNPGDVFRLRGLEAEAFEVPHGGNDISIGFEIRLQGRSILYSGDTGWTEDLVARSKGKDLFICECSFYETRLDSHLDYRRIAQNRERFGSKRIILTHLGEEVLAARGRITMETAYDGLEVEI